MPFFDRTLHSVYLRQNQTKLFDKFMFLVRILSASMPPLRTSRVRVGEEPFHLRLGISDRTSTLTTCLTPNLFDASPLPRVTGGYDSAFGIHQRHGNYGSLSLSQSLSPRSSRPSSPSPLRISTIEPYNHSFVNLQEHPSRTWPHTPTTLAPAPSRI